MKIIDCQQGSEQWAALRCLYITASELDNLITPAKLQLSKGQDVNTYLCRKVAERWLGYPLDEVRGWAVEQGSILEEEAIPWYEKSHKVTIERPGLIVRDTEDFACSPDGWMPAEGIRGRGLELKCPQPTNHVKWLAAGGCPREHYLQVQGSMFATGAEEWDFVSYCRDFPPLEVTVPVNLELGATIAEAVEAGNTEIGRLTDYLTKLNGGPPPRARRRPPVESDPDPFGVTAPEATSDHLRDALTRSLR